jgi:FkbM family methyltransferase
MDRTVILDLFLLRLRKIYSALTIRLYARAFFHGVFASVEHSSALSQFVFDFVVDVGANKGQFTTFARRTFPAARIVSFEPLEEPAIIFEALFREDHAIRLVRAAVSTWRGDLNMYVTEQNDSSSPLHVAAAQAEAFGTKVVECRRVRCGRLSDFVGRNEFGTNNLLKIDTQGFELEVLKGCTELLDRFTVIYCELSFTELYEGQPLADEVICYLHGFGFRLAAIYNQMTGLDKKALQADMLFVKVDSISLGQNS